jgi:hypothetical protein
VSTLRIFGEDVEANTPGDFERYVTESAIVVHYPENHGRLGGWKGMAGRSICVHAATKELARDALEAAVREEVARLGPLVGWAPAMRWTCIDYDDPNTLPRDDEHVLVRWSHSGRSGVMRARWEPEPAHWFDDETDGTNSQLEWPCGEITHWAAWPEFTGDSK